MVHQARTYDGKREPTVVHHAQLVYKAHDQLDYCSFTYNCNDHRARGACPPMLMACPM